MKDVHVKGAIISNNEAWVYDFLEMEYTSPNVIRNQLEPEGTEPLNIIINSGGGNVFAGSEIYTMLKDYNGEVTVKIVGLAGSASSVIAMAGDKVLMSPTGQLMIHNVSVASSGGNHNDYAKTAEMLKGLDRSLCYAYQLKTGKSETDILELMDKETWFNAKSALEHNFIDEIMFNDEMVLTASLSNTLSADAVNKLLNLKIQAELAKEKSNYPEDPIIEDPIIEDPIIEEPIIEDPIIEEPIIEEPEAITLNRFKKY